MYVNEKSIGADVRASSTAELCVGTWHDEGESRRGHLPWKMRLLQQFFHFIDFSSPCSGTDGMIYDYWLRWHGLADYVTKKGANFIMSGYKYFPIFPDHFRPPFYVYLYWTHKSNGETWIWMGKMLRAIYGGKHKHGQFAIDGTSRMETTNPQDNFPSLVYQFISN